MGADVHERYINRSIKDYWDYYSTMKTAHKKGRAEGRAEGIEEGLAKGRAEGIEEGLAKGRAEGIAEGLAKGEMAKSVAIARNLKQMGIALEDIAAATGLSKDDINSL